MAPPVSLAALDFNLLKVLEALFTERSVTRAGARIGRSQPAVSNALTRLRYLLDDELLVRGPRGLVLTPRAEAMRRPLHEAIGLIEACLTEGRSFEPAIATGSLRMAMPDRLGLSLLPPLHAVLRISAPNIAIEVTTADSSLGPDLLEEGKVDIALGWIVDPPRHIHTEELFREQLFVVCRQRHPLLRTRAPDLAALLAFPHLVVSATGGRNAIFDSQLAERGLERRAAVAVTNFTSVPQLLAGSDMLAVFTERAARVFGALPGLAIRPAPDTLDSIVTLMAWHARTERDHRFLWLRDRIREVGRTA